MKKVLITMALFVGLTGFAQKREHRGHKKGMHNDLTAEQIATLKTKKMALALDLSKAQQQQVMALNVEEAKFRKANRAERKENRENEEKERPNAEERFEMQNEHLDRRLAHQEKLKQILNDEQYQTWKKLNHKRHVNGRKRMSRSRKR